MRLTVLSGEESEEIVEATGERFVVGRDAGCDLALAGEGVADQHAALERLADGRYLLRDLGSIAGTFVNGTRLAAPVVLEGGEEIRVGDTLLRVSAPAAAPASAVSPRLTGRGRWLLVAACLAFLAAAGAMVTLVAARDESPAALAQPGAATSEPETTDPPETTQAPATTEPAPTEPAPTVPEVIPPGAPMAFVGNQDGDFEIYLMAVDGTVTQLTSNTGDDRRPALSPDGTKVAFASSVDGDVLHDIYVVNVDGTGLTQLTSEPGDDDVPSWSPDGSRIAFHSDRDGDFEIFVMNAEGSGVAQLTVNETTDGDPVFSPDPAIVRIAYDADPEGDGAEQVYVMNGDGSGATQLTTSGNSGLPAWSPDGSRIAFQSDAAGDVDVYVVNADGSGLTQLTTDSSWDGAPDWLADGRLAFHSDRNGEENWDVFVMNADGSGLTGATGDPAHDIDPSFAVPPLATGEETDAAAQLLTHVPEAIRATCATDEARPDGTVVGVVCSAEGISVGYWQFESAQALADWYDLWLASLGVERDQGDCVGTKVAEGTYNSNGVQAGRFMCAPGGAGRIILWAHDGLAIGAIASADRTGRAVRQAIFDFWTNGGPI